MALQFPLTTQMQYLEDELASMQRKMDEPATTPKSLWEAELYQERLEKCRSAYQDLSLRNLVYPTSAQFATVRAKSNNFMNA